MGYRFPEKNGPESRKRWKLPLAHFGAIVAAHLSRWFFDGIMGQLLDLSKAPVFVLPLMQGIVMGLTYWFCINRHHTPKIPKGKELRLTRLQVLKAVLPWTLVTLALSWGLIGLMYFAYAMNFPEPEVMRAYVIRWAYAPGFIALMQPTCMLAQYEWHWHKKVILHYGEKE